MLEVLKKVTGSETVSPEQLNMALSMLNPLFVSDDDQRKKVDEGATVSTTVEHVPTGRADPSLRAKRYEPQTTQETATIDDTYRDPLDDKTVDKFKMATVRSFKLLQPTEWLDDSVMM